METYVPVITQTPQMILMDKYVVETCVLKNLYYFYHVPYYFSLKKNKTRKAPTDVHLYNDLNHHLRSQ